MGWALLLITHLTNLSGGAAAAAAVVCHPLSLPTHIHVHGVCAAVILSVHDIWMWVRKREGDDVGGGGGAALYLTCIGTVGSR